MSAERRLLILLLCAPLLGFIGVMAADAVPSARIADHLIDAERAGILTETSDPGPTPLGTTAALYTECTVFSLGLADVPGEDFVANALLGTAYTGCQRLGAALDSYAENGELPSGYSYLRYWHGYSILTRPGLGLVGVAGTRWLSFAFMAVAVGGMCAAVRRSFGTAPAVLLLAPTLLTTDVVIGSLSTSTAIGTGSAWVAGWLSFVLVKDRPAWRSGSARGRTRRCDHRLPRPDDDDAWVLRPHGRRGDARRDGCWCSTGGTRSLAGERRSRRRLGDRIGRDVGIEMAHRIIGRRARDGDGRGDGGDRVPPLLGHPRRHRFARTRSDDQRRGVVGPAAHAVGGVRDACRRRLRHDQVAALQGRARIDGWSVARLVAVPVVAGIWR